MAWADLPADVAAAIADRLTEAADLARFRSVCPSWRSASAAHAARRRVPLLLLPTQRWNDRDSRDVWSPADDSLREIALPAASRGRSFLFGSHHGWTLAVAAADLSAVLVHPFTGASADLPALPFPRRHGDYDDDPVPRDVVWDWSPHGVVVVSPGNGAFFCFPGAASWRALGCSSAGISSVTYCDGTFYLFDGKDYRAAVVDAAALAVASLDLPTLKLPLPRWGFEASLVVSPDELLLLVRTELLHTGCTGWPKSLTAFRADRAAGGGASSSWSEVAGIGDRAVFVDHLRAFCVEANGVNGVRGNCMYVATSYEMVNDDYGMDVWGRYSVSVLDLADLTTEDLGYGNLLKRMCARGFWQWPSWSLPNLR